MTSQKPHRELAGCSFPAQPQARTSSCSHPVPHLPALALVMPGGSLTLPVPHPICPHPQSSVSTYILPPVLLPRGPGAAVCAHPATRAPGAAGAPGRAGSALPRAPHLHPAHPAASSTLCR